MNDYVLYIGRFQPFHNGHYASLKYALSIAKKMIIILGGYQLSACITDPWTALERKKMILSVLGKTERKRVQFIFVRDRLYNEDLWKENVTQEVKSITKGNQKTVIIGHMKDNTSYYLKIFPQWQYIETGNFYGLNGTNFREKYFGEAHPSYMDIPSNVAKFLKNFRKGKLFKHLQNEFHFSKDFIAHLPNKNIHFSYIFLQVGHYLLLEKRDQFPGKNLYSLPLLESVRLEPKDNQYCIARQKFYLQKYDGMEKREKEVHFYRIPYRLALDLSKYGNLKHTTPATEIYTSLLVTYVPWEHTALLAPRQNLSGRGSKWILLDDFYLMENKMFADHYQIIKTLMQ